MKTTFLRKLFSAKLAAAIMLTLMVAINLPSVARASDALAKDANDELMIKACMIIENSSQGLSLLDSNIDKSLPNNLRKAVEIVRLDAEPEEKLGALARTYSTCDNLLYAYVVSAILDNYIGELKPVSDILLVAAVLCYLGII